MCLGVFDGGKSAANAITIPATLVEVQHAVVRTQCSSEGAVMEWAKSFRSYKRSMPKPSTPTMVLTANNFMNAVSYRP